MYPDVVRTDNGPEFTSRAFMGWAQTHGIRHILIQPGRPMLNGYIKSGYRNRALRTQKNTALPSRLFDDGKGEQCFSVLHQFIK